MGTEKKNEGRDLFTLQVMAWIQDIIRGLPALDPQKQEEEFQKLLAQPFEAFER